MDKMYKIVEKTKIWFAVSIIVILIGLVSFGMKGLNYGIDFKGGTVVSINIGKDFNVDEVRDIAAKYDTSAQVQKVEGNEVTIRSDKFTDKQIADLFKDIKTKYTLQDTALLSTDRIGPSVGQELRHAAVLSMLVATLGILIYVSFRFELRTGIAAIISLLHDLLITFAVYAFFQIPVNSSFIAALLTILGYSINDTIVVFDRIRENRRVGHFKDYKTLVNASLTQTMSRSINTVLTVLITITCVYIFGVPAIREFAFPLIIGIASGCYSSIFIASPLWVVLERNKKYA